MAPPSKLQAATTGGSAAVQARETTRSLADPAPAPTQPERLTQNGDMIVNVDDTSSTDVSSNRMRDRNSLRQVIDALNTVQISFEI